MLTIFSFELLPSNITLLFLPVRFIDRFKKNYVLKVLISILDWYLCLSPLNQKFVIIVILFLIDFFIIGRDVFASPEEEEAIQNATDKITFYRNHLKDMESEAEYTKSDPSISEEERAAILEDCNSEALNAKQNIAHYTNVKNLASGNQDNSFNSSTKRGISDDVSDGKNSRRRN